MKNTTNYKELFNAKKAVMDVLEDILTDIDRQQNYLLSDWKAVGEEQRKDDDGNLLYVDEDGNRTTEVTDKPYMKTLYEDVTITYDELSDYSKAKYDAYEKIKSELMKLA
jgi:hypothetical protein